MRHAWQEKYVQSLVEEPGGRRSLRSPSRRLQKNTTLSFTDCGIGVSGPDLSGRGRRSVTVRPEHGDMAMNLKLA